MFLHIVLKIAVAKEYIFRYIFTDEYIILKPLNEVCLKTCLFLCLLLTRHFPSVISHSCEELGAKHLSFTTQAH